jgi:hypothetical protein
MLELPDVTLVLIETLEHELGRLAINQCLSKVRFGEVLICTDKQESFFPLKAVADGTQVRFVQVPNWPTKLGWSRFSWFGLPQLMNTSHALTIQWDSWIIDRDAWRDEFLDYDICGAPWDWHPTRKVGNLGFGLRSTKLMKFVRDNRDVFPCNTDVDDDLLCRVYRAKLEECGFLWAPVSVARDFAFECTAPEPDKKYFGFHGAFNFGHVLVHDQLFERARLMFKSPYLGASKRGSYIWKAFVERHPDIVKQVEAQEAGIAEVFGGEGEGRPHHDPGVLAKAIKRTRGSVKKSGRKRAA